MVDLTATKNHEAFGAKPRRLRVVLILGFFVRHQLDSSNAQLVACEGTVISQCRCTGSPKLFGAGIETPTCMTSTFVDLASSAACQEAAIRPSIGNMALACPVSSKLDSE